MDEGITFLFIYLSIYFFVGDYLSDYRGGSRDIFEMTYVESDVDETVVLVDEARLDQQRRQRL